MAISVGREEDDYDALSIPITDKRFVNAVKKRFNIIAQYKNYKLLKTKSRSYEGIEYFLVDTNVKTVGQYFIGVMVTEMHDKGLYNLKKGFGIELEKVKWSNIGLELKGQGLGKMMYTLVYNYITTNGKGLESDYTLFEGSIGIWMNYMSTIATYFGIVIGDIMIPIPKEEVTKKNNRVFELYDIDGFVAMETPPPMVRKIAYNVKGLSFIEGDYGVVTMKSDKVNDKLDVTDSNSKSSSKELSTFVDYLNNFDTLNSLINSPLKNSINDIIATKKSKCRTLIFTFDDAVLIVKQLPGGLSIIPL
jgi:hypothetical protein